MIEKSVWAVFAHPDDETFRRGRALAILARRGVRVQVLTGTRAPLERPRLFLGREHFLCATGRTEPDFFSEFEPA